MGAPLCEQGCPMIAPDNDSRSAETRFSIRTQPFHLITRSNAVDDTKGKTRETRETRWMDGQIPSTVKRVLLEFHTRLRTIEAVSQRGGGGEKRSAFDSRSFPPVKIEEISGPTRYREAKNYYFSFLRRIPLSFYIRFYTYTYVQSLK